MHASDRAAASRAIALWLRLPGIQGLRCKNEIRRGCKLVLIHNDVSADVKPGRKLVALVAVQGSVS
jgi:hypothetical protein